MILLDPRAEDRADAPASVSPRRLAVMLGAILLLGAALRFAGLNWDAGQHLHPDERFVTMVENAIQWPKSVGEYFDSAQSPLNPYNRGFGSFVYGTVPLFIVRAIAEVGNWNNYTDVTLLGRALSALLDLGTVVVVFLIGRRLFDWRVAVLAALLVAVTPLHIQQAHYFTMESFLVFFLTVAFYFAVRTAQEGGTLNYVLLGVFYGLATASKINAATFGVVVLAACLLRAWQEWRRERRLGTLEEPATGFCVALILALVTFRLGQPYAFAGPGPFDVALAPRYLTDLDQWRKIGSGEVDYPPSVQWANRAAYVYPLQQLLLWGMGPLLGLACWAGAALAAVVLVRRWRQRPRGVGALRAAPLLLALPLVWIGFNWWYWGGAFLKPMRYFLPTYPLLILLGAWALIALVDWARRPVAAAEVGAAAPRVGWAWLRPRLGIAAVLLVAGATTLSVVAYTTIYLRTTTRVAASEWIYANLPPGTRVANEHWDDPVPLRLPTQDSARWAGPQLELYAEEEPSKLERLVQALDQSDVIAITSNRLYDSIPRIPERYPLAIEYYRLLFGGELGFRPVATFTSYPQLGPLVFPDDAAEELWTVYDHPKVILFQKTPEYSSERARALLARAPLDRAVKGLKPLHAHTHGLLLPPAVRAADEAGGTWSNIVQRDSLINQFAPLSWWLLAILLGWIAYPLTWAVLGRLADRGYAVAKILAIVLVAWAAWLLASLRWLPYSRATILLALGALCLVAAAVVWRRRAAFLADLRARWELLLFTEALFTAGYVFFLGIRMANPDLWHPNFGGEKPMDFAYLNAVLKSTYFPPYDPWFAGGYINYYYFGQVLVATLIKLTGTVPAVAYNLAVALFFALLLSGSFSFVFNWLLATARKPADDGGSGPSPSRVAWATGGGLVTALLVCILGNLDGLVQLVENLGKASTVTLNSAIPGVAGLARAAAGLIAVVIGGMPLASFDFWRSTRVIGPEDPGPITEFPYFTFLYGDLHAHLLALPLTILVLHLALGLVRGEGVGPLWRTLTQPSAVADPAAARGGLRTHLAAWLPRLGAVARQEVVWLVALAGLTIGLLRATNTWDFPTYLLLFVGAGAVAEYRAAGRLSLAVAIRAAALAAATFVVASLVIRPYLASYALFYTGVEPVRHHTSLVHYLTVLGLFLFAVGSLLAYETWVVRRRLLPLVAVSALLEQPGPAQGFWSPAEATLPRGGILAAGAAGLWLFAAAVLALGGHVVPAVVVLLLGPVVWLTPWHRQRADRLLLLGMIALALALTAAVEFVALKGDIGRMNTVFKFYLQAWVLLGLASAIGIVLLVRRGWAARGHPRLLPASAGWRWWSVAAGLLLLGCLIYPLLATPAKLALRFTPLPPTLDGMAYMQTAVYHDRNQALPLNADYQALLWLQDNVPGSPVILEANTGLYKWGSRVSIYTGLPTVVGWDWHQRQQRGDFSPQVEERVRDVQRMYETTQPAELLTLLRRYGVEYVYVGPLERAYYSEPGLRKFRDLVGTALDLVYDRDGVQIYRVRKET
jgi:YYY domain-containing protein